MRASKIVSTSEWSSPPDELVLREDEVHVWRASLELGPARVQALLKTLSTDERAKAERFYFERDRSHFIVARGLLRVILGRYLKTDPRCLRFRYNFYGKPALAPESELNNYRFNLSHSHGLLLLALVRNREIGVDLDRLDAELGGQAIAERFFTSSEVANICSLPTNQREEAFLKYWTRKEAYVKARGQGLAMPLDKFEVSLSSVEPAALLNTDASGETFDWSLEELHPGPGYVAALAVQGHYLRLKCWQWLEQY